MLAAGVVMVEEQVLVVADDFIFAESQRRQRRRVDEGAVAFGVGTEHALAERFKDQALAQLALVQCGFGADLLGQVDIKTEHDRSMVECFNDGVA